ncbi:MAG TPA: hypothetical protein VFF27_10690, partial [Bacteroidia bacterium]|nr:hypothetical protein [Bacteroidia bacterium]
MKIKQLLLLSITWISTSIIFSSCNENDGEQYTEKIKKVEITQNFEVGNHFKYEVQRGKIDSQVRDSDKYKSSTDIDFTVLGEKNGMKECSWKYGATSILGAAPEQIDQRTRNLINIYKGIELRFLIDEKGAFHEITNYEECKAAISNQFKFIYENASSKTTPEQFEKMSEAMSATYDTPEKLISTYFPELSLFFNLFGKTVEADSIYHSKTELSNPFGGRNFPAELTTQL